MTGAPGAWIEDLAWPRSRRASTAAPDRLGIGALAKEHGHHLPMKTDYLLARALATASRRAAGPRRAGLSFGYYPAFVRYPGSQHLAAETFIAVLHDVLDGFIRHGVRRLAIVNTGVSTEGPSASPCATPRAARRPRRRRRHRAARQGERALQQKLGGHGDEHETSLILAIEPDSVRLGPGEAELRQCARSPRPCSTGPRSSRRPARASTTATPACAAIRPSRPPRRGATPWPP